ncbi:MAG: hypothetical protein HC843_13945 [Sphingomonadales bacterium]|nr:hypothetical protein [Sphingomonadales bacterium]
MNAIIEACGQYWWLPFLLAAIIGLLTAWWIWGGAKEVSVPEPKVVEVEPPVTKAAEPAAAAPLMSAPKVKVAPSKKAPAKKTVVKKEVVKKEAVKKAELKKLRPKRPNRKRPHPRQRLHPPKDSG